MSQRFLVLYENNDFESLKAMLEECYSVNLQNNILYQKLIIKKDTKKYDLYILPTDITVFLADTKIEQEICDLNFKKNELLTFNSTNNKLYAYNIFDSFDKFLTQDGFFNFPDFNEFIFNNISNEETQVLQTVETGNVLKESKATVVNLILTGSFSSGKTSFINTVNQILVENYNENTMWLPAFDYETTFGIFKIHYKTDISKPVLKNESGKEINHQDFPIGKNIDFIQRGEEDKDIRLEIQRKYFQRNQEINIEFPLKKEYQNKNFKNLILIDTPGIKSVNKTFEKIKPHLNELDIKGYLFLLKTSYTDESYLDKSTNLEENFNQIIQEILPQTDYSCVFDLFLNDDYLYKNLEGNGRLYNFDISMNFKRYIFNHNNLFPLSNTPLSMKFDEPLQDFFLESNALVNFLERFYFKVLIVEEFKKLELNFLTQIKHKQKELEPIKSLLEDLSPYYNINLNLRELLLQILRIFFNNYRNLYEEKILNKDLVNSDKILIISEFHLFLDEIFNNQIILTKEMEQTIYNGLNINALEPVLSSLQALNKNFPKYFFDLKNSLIKIYKVFLKILLDKLPSFTFDSYPDFNNAVEKSIRETIEENKELNNLIREFNLIRNSKEEESIKIENLINYLNSDEKVKEFHNLLYKN